MERIFVIPDTHVPYHDPRSWKLALQVIKQIRPHKVVIIGDFADFYAVSDHDRDPMRKDSLEWEVECVNAELDRLEELMDRDVVFIEGNHEDRLRRYLWKKAPQLFGVTDVKRLFRLDQRGWIHRPYRHGWKYGNVTYKHDVAGRSGKHAAAQSLADFGGNVVIGHTHRGGVVYLGEAKGANHFCLNVGWLGDVKLMDYMDPDKALRDWQLGFGTVIHDGPSRAFGSFHPIVKGRCEVDGVIYDTPLS